LPAKSNIIKFLKRRKRGKVIINSKDEFDDFVSKHGKI
jgi:hypothetical protein